MFENMVYTNLKLKVDHPLKTGKTAFLGLIKCLFLKNLSQDLQVKKNETENIDFYRYIGITFYICYGR